MCCPARATSRCWSGESCTYLRRRCCFFHNLVEEVAAASSVGHDTGCFGDVATEGLLPPLAWLLEQLAEVIKALPQEPIEERVVEQIVATPVPPICMKIVESSRVAPQERTQERDVEEQRSDILVPQNKDKIAGVTQPVPHVRTQERVGEQIVACHVPSNTAKIAAVTQLAPFERMQERVGEQIVACCVSANSAEFIERFCLYRWSDFNDEVQSRLWIFPCLRPWSKILETLRVLGACKNVLRSR